MDRETLAKAKMLEKSISHYKKSMKRYMMPSTI